MEFINIRFGILSQHFVARAIGWPQQMAPLSLMQAYFVAVLKIGEGNKLQARLSALK
jgi:hypothetical protein